MPRSRSLEDRDKGQVSRPPKIIIIRLLGGLISNDSGINLYIMIRLFFLFLKDIFFVKLNRVGKSSMGQPRFRHRTRLTAELILE